jgi:hypothetical protein
MPHLRDLDMIQLCQHCWEIALVKVWTLGLVSKCRGTNPRSPMGPAKIPYTFGRGGGSRKEQI